MLKSYKQFVSQIHEITDKFDSEDYHAFAYWFAETTFGYDEKKILDSICDGTHDKGVDVVLTDDKERKVMVIQSKYEREGNKTQAKENDVKLLTTVREYFNSRSSLNSILHNANPVAKRLLVDAFEKIKKDKYELQLIFITTHKEIPNIHNIMRDTFQFKKGEYSLYFFKGIIELFSDSLRDFTPSIGNYNLPFKDSDKNLIRSLKSSKYSSWIVSVPLEEIRAMATKYRDKLFRKNVRNFLGKSVCNIAITNTLNIEQENFWYYNNGITILADESSINMEEGYIGLKNPQIVNGCQTARSIEKYNGELKGDVMVRIIESRDHDFINMLTLYQNTSNPVRKRDLKSNDPIQIRLKHQFKYKKYYYEVKRGEDFYTLKKQHPAMKNMYLEGEIDNEDVAKLLATVKISAYIGSSKGSELFFGDEYENIFDEKITTNQILALIFLRDEIKDEYIGEKNRFYTFERPFVFKNRALFLVLRLLYDSISNIKNWEDRFVKFYDTTSDKDRDKFSRALKRITSEHFKIIYRCFRISKESYHNTYLQAKNTLRDIKKANSQKINQLMVETKNIFNKWI